MGQRRIVGGAAILTAIIFAVAVVSHLKHEPNLVDRAKEPRVASVTPAGTSLVCGIGAADHLVGVCTFDDEREGFTNRPKIGDYEKIDWEKLAPLHPQILITQYGQDRFPTGLEDRCKSMNIRILNIHIDLLDDIYRETQNIADALGEGEKGKKAVTELKAGLDAVRSQVAGRPPVNAIVVMSDDGLALAGPGEFLDELLSIAGGQNAAAPLKDHYLSVDRERLLAMNPQVIIQLIYNGDKTPQVMEKAKQFWDEMPNLAAVKNHRVYILTDWYVLEPGLHVAELAQKFADLLHPEDPQMKRWSFGTLAMTILLCAAACALAGVLCLSVGSTGIRWPDADDRTIRLQSIVVASLVGAALAAAGVAYQAILRNPLADPYLLGVSSGASLAAYLWRLPLLGSITAAIGIPGAAIGQWSQQGFAFGGALVAVSIVLGLAGRRGRLDPVTLLLVGVIVNAVSGSLFLLVNARYKDMPGTGGAMSFLVGGIQSLQFKDCRSAAALMLVGWIVLLYVSGQLNIAGLADSEAESLGVRINRLRWIALIAASLMTAAAVSISGPIGFVGLVCPHVARMLVGSDQRRLLPVGTAAGVILLMSADAASRFLGSEEYLRSQLPVGVLTGLLGGPFFLWLLFKSRLRT